MSKSVGTRSAKQHRMSADDQCEALTAPPPARRAAALVQVFAVAGNGSASAGVFEGSLLIDSRAPLGTYAVVAEAGELGAELSVSVDEYVLPKFEIELEVEQEYLSPATKELTGTVRAVYSYGEGVAGAATFTLRKQSYGWECQPRGAPEMPVAEEDARQAPGGFAGSMPPLPGGDCDTVLATVPAAQLEGGEYAFTIPRPSGLDTWGTLNLDVSITEEATGAGTPPPPPSPRPLPHLPDAHMLDVASRSC